jgi:hypothetical protein
MARTDEGRELTKIICKNTKLSLEQRYVVNLTILLVGAEIE